MPDASGMMPPYLDPSQYPDYLEVQRRQMIANMLTNAMQTSGQTPQDWNSMKVVPKRGLALNLAPLVGGLMAGRAQQSAREAERNYFQGIYGGGQGGQNAAPSAPSATAAPSLAPSPDPNSQDVAPIVQRNGQSFAQAVSPPQGAPPSSGNPMLLTGDPRTSQMLMGMMGPQKYGEALGARYQPTEFEKQLRAAGIDPNSPLGRQMLQTQVAKAGYVPPVDVRPQATLVDPFTKQPIFTAPGGGVQTNWTPQGPVASPIPGAQETEARGKGMDTAAQVANTPHYEPDPFHPGEVRAVYPPTPPALGGASGPTGQPSVAPPGAPQAPHPAAPPSTGAQSGNSALALEQQKEAGKAGAQSGQTYSDQLNKNAISATEVRRSLAELKNLSTSAAPGALNAAKQETGAYMIAAGMAPATVSKLLGVDIDALTAASKQTGSLALDSIHDMTSRGTNFDLATFMRYNPNLNMASPGGFTRVLDFMDKRMQQEVAKQSDFSQWSQSVPSNQWATGHTARWLKLQNDLISSGKTNSRPPLTSFVTP